MQNDPAKLGSTSAKEIGSEQKAPGDQHRKQKHSSIVCFDGQKRIAHVIDKPKNDTSGRGDEGKK